MYWLMFSRCFDVLCHDTSQQQGRVLALGATGRPWETILLGRWKGRKWWLSSGGYARADPQLQHPSTTAPQPNFTSLVTAQLVGGHLCGGPRHDGAGYSSVKSHKGSSGGLLSRFLHGAKQEAAENPMSISLYP